MVTTLDIFEVIIVVISWISQVILSSSILIVYIMEWKKKRRFSVSDKIFIYMALTNLLLQSTTAIDYIIYMFWFYQMMIAHGYLLVFVFNIFLVYDNIWHNMWLSIHYCLKLVNPSHSVFIQMKKRLSASIVALLIVTSVGVLLINLPYIWTVGIELPPNKTNNPSVKMDINHQDNTFTTCNIIIGCCLPFLVTLLCIGLSVGSLMRHMWRIRLNSSQLNSSPQLQGHVRAAGTMILQLLLNLFLYLSVIGVFTFFSNLNLTWVAVMWSSIMFNPCAQTLTIILGNPKLKKEIIKLLS